MTHRSAAARMPDGSRRRSVLRHLGRPAVAVLTVAVLAGGAAAGPAYASPSKPTDKDVRDAQRAVTRAASSVAEMEIRLAQLSAQADAAELAVQQAGEAYTQALADADAAQLAAQQAAQRSTEADANAESARRTLVAMAREMARSGGSTEGLQAVLSADGFQDVARRSSALEHVTGKADEAVQGYRAAQLVAATFSARAKAASDTAAAARQAAEDALATAKQTQQASDDALAAGAAERDQLITQLAAARQTSAEVEAARQAQIEADNRARADAAARAAALAAQPKPAAPPASTGSTGGSSNASTGGSAGGSTGGSAGGSTGGSAGGSTGGSSGGSTGGGTTTTPPPTTPPATAPGLGTGSSRGSAGQGQAAVDWARTRLGIMYGWGATGPDAYDCSGLTMRAWQAAGVNLNRTSRDQYKQVLKISYSDLRVGDLLFWSTDPNNADAIYHVAMWAGNGQIVEAPSEGKPVRVTAMRWGGVMPYAGRP